MAVPVFKRQLLWLPRVESGSRFSWVAQTAEQMYQLEAQNNNQTAHLYTLTPGGPVPVQGVIAITRGQVIQDAMKVTGGVYLPESRPTSPGTRWSTTFTPPSSAQTRRVVSSTIPSRVRPSVNCSARTSSSTFSVKSNRCSPRMAASLFRFSCMRSTPKTCRCISTTRTQKHCSKTPCWTHD